MPSVLHALHPVVTRIDTSHRDSRFVHNNGTVVSGLCVCVCVCDRYEMMLHSCYIHVSLSGLFVCECAERTRVHGMSNGQASVSLSLRVWGCTVVKRRRAKHHAKHYACAVSLSLTHHACKCKCVSLLCLSFVLACGFLCTHLVVKGLEFRV